MKKVLGPVLLVVLIVGVVGAVFFSARDQFDEMSVVTIRGLIGSEKEAFFKDPRVIEALRSANLEVQVEKAGSRQIADKLQQGDYDFASPSGVPAAEKIRREQPDSTSYEIFFTPMALASWSQIGEILEANGVAENQGDFYTFDMARFLDLVQNDTRWEDLNNNDAYNVSKLVLISSTDVRTSNSAAMYLALASFVANENNVIQDSADIKRVMPLMETIFLEQGYQEGSSAVPFNDYLTMGIGKAPMVMIYESQFLYQAATEGGVSPDMLLMYPEPTIYTKHFIIALNEDADRLGKLLRNDPEIQNDPDLQSAAAQLQQLAVEHGFRTSDAASFREFTTQKNIAVNDNLVNVIDPPTFEVLEEMIQRIEQQF
jgi:hypothetical protein